MNVAVPFRPVHILYCPLKAQKYRCPSTCVLLVSAACGTRHGKGSIEASPIEFSYVYLQIIILGNRQRELRVADTVTNPDNVAHHALPRNVNKRQLHLSFVPHNLFSWTYLAENAIAHAHERVHTFSERYTIHMWRCTSFFSPSLF